MQFFKYDLLLIWLISFLISIIKLNKSFFFISVLSYNFNSHNKLLSSLIISNIFSLCLKNKQYLLLESLKYKICFDFFCLKTSLFNKTNFLLLLIFFKHSSSLLINGIFSGI